MNLPNLPPQLPSLVICIAFAVSAPGPKLLQRVAGLQDFFSPFSFGMGSYFEGVKEESGVAPWSLTPHLARSTPETIHK